MIITKSSWFCYIKKIYFVISQIRFFWYHKTDFLISQNIPDFFYITNSSFWYYKLDFVISKNQDDFFISKNRFCDITKYEVFSTDEMMTPIKKASASVFPITKMADRDTFDPRESDILLNIQQAILIICGSYHFSKELKGKNYFVISQNRLFDITRS